MNIQYSFHNSQDIFISVMAVYRLCPAHISQIMQCTTAHIPHLFMVCTVQLLVRYKIIKSIFLWGSFFSFFLQIKFEKENAWSLLACFSSPTCLGGRKVRNDSSCSLNLYLVLRCS